MLRLVSRLAVAPVISSTQRMVELFWSEFLGTAVLVLLGNAVVASILLKGSKGEDAGWLAIATGWAFALFVAIWVAAKSNAHLNPAVSIALAVIGDFDVAKVPVYVAAQFLGAAAGQILVILHFWPHWKGTLDGDTKRACFCTAPAIRAPVWNAVGEAIATMVLVFGVLSLGTSPWERNLGGEITDEWSWFAFGIAGLLWAIGIGLGGTTGFAINPARDLAPRILHAILPIPGKTNSDWGYAWVPVVGPIVGGTIGAILAKTFGFC